MGANRSVIDGLMRDGMSHSPADVEQSGGSSLLFLFRLSSSSFSCARPQRASQRPPTADFSHSPSSMAPGRDDDPLTRVLAPPPGESAADRESRLLAEAEAKRISDAIDEELLQQAKAEKKAPKPMKMLLLGM